MTTQAKDPSQGDQDLAAGFRELAEKYNMPDLADPKKAVAQFGSLLRGMNKGLERASKAESRLKEVDPLVELYERDEKFRESAIAALSGKAPVETSGDGGLKSDVEFVKKRLLEKDFEGDMTALESTYGIVIDPVTRAEIQDEMRERGLTDAKMVAKALLVDRIAEARAGSADRKRAVRDGRGMANDGQAAGSTVSSRSSEVMEAPANEREGVRREIFKDRVREGGSLW